MEEYLKRMRYKLVNLENRARSIMDGISVASPVEAVLKKHRGLKTINDVLEFKVGIEVMVKRFIAEIPQTSLTREEKERRRRRLELLLSRARRYADGLIVVMR